MRICTNAEMRELDRLAEEQFFIHPAILMENAGRAAVDVLFEFYPEAGKHQEILVFAGKGNNAGDAFVVARRLLGLDRKVRVFHLVDGEQYQGDAKKNFDILKSLKAKMVQLESGAELKDFFDRSMGPFVAVDGILGTGLKGDVQGIFFEVIELVNQYASDIIALDIPSGVNGDSGAVQGASIFADFTVSFGFPRLGHFLPPGAARRGRLVNVDISLPGFFRKEGNKFLLMKESLTRLLHKRDRYGHKNSFGHTLLIGGSPGKTGAVSMAAKATLKIGTGLVTLATWEDALDTLTLRTPDELMVRPIGLSDREIEKSRERLNEFSSIVIGPGLGQRPEGKKLMEEVLNSYQGPLVIDADGLNLIAEHDLHPILLHRKGATVLTPHPGEIARLLGVSNKEVTARPDEAVKRLVDQTHSIVVLKGAATLISSSDEILHLNHYPNDGMATAGTGDVLAGMIGGLLGQGMDDLEATQLAVYLHSLAGGLAADQHGHRSMTAIDVIENIGEAFKSLKTEEKEIIPREIRVDLL
jgi:ADP-dependent NAD(P)H-hydrate dehydratase / NAD(P)H-hydrate epimerase